MVVLDMYKQPVGKEYSVMRGVHENMYKQTSWKEAQKIIDDYKKKQSERMKTMETNYADETNDANEK